jgi:hypothetical protein
MLLAGRRRGLIFLCLAGMEMAWFTPFFLVFCRPAANWPPLAGFGGLLAAQVAWLLALEGLNRLDLDWPYYELAVAGLVVATSLALVRLLLPFDAGFNLAHNADAIVVLVLANLFVWQRAIHATSRGLDFFSVGFTFRLGTLLLFLGWTIFYYYGDSRQVTPFLWIYFGLGLVAVALARLYEKGSSAQSAGTRLPLRRLAQLLLAVGVTLGGAAWLSQFYTPAAIKAVLTWLTPLWVVLGGLLLWLAQILIWLLAPVVSWLIEVLSRWLAGIDWTPAAELLQRMARVTSAMQPVGQDNKPVALPAWLLTGIQVVAILLAAAVLLGLLLLYLERIRPHPGRDEVEEEAAEDVTLGGGLLGQGVRWLKTMAGLVGRFGLSRQLLAAISVQNIYANLCRLARLRGYPRRPSQPPDAYLPVLARAFPGQDAALVRITMAYMRVHYGDQPVDPAELAQLRYDYQGIRTAEKRAQATSIGKP